MTETALSLGAGWSGYIVILVAGTLMTEPWRWAGVRLSRDLDVDSEIFHWVRAVSTALVAGLVTRMLTFPTGALQTIPLSIRLAAFVAGIAIYYAGGRSLASGVIGGTAVLLAGAVLFT